MKTYWKRLARLTILAACIVFYSPSGFTEDCLLAKEWFNKANNLSDQMERKAFYYNKSIELCPDFIDPYIGLMANQLKTGDYEDVIEIGKKGLKIDPFEPGLHFNIAIGYEELEKYDDAIIHLQRASELFEPRKMEEKAIAQLLWIYYNRQSDYSATYEILRNVVAQPIVSFRKPYFYNTYAWILAVCPDMNKEQEALDFAKKAHELLTDKWFVKDTLAAAYARNGYYEEAIEMQEEAIEMLGDESKGTKREHLVAASDRLKTYRSGKAYEKKDVNCPKGED